MRNIMYLLKDKFQGGVVISQTDELNKFWRQYVPKKYIFNKYDPEILAYSNVEADISIDLPHPSGKRRHWSPGCVHHK